MSMSAPCERCGARLIGSTQESAMRVPQWMDALTRSLNDRADDLQDGASHCVHEQSKTEMRLRGCLLRDLAIALESASIVVLSDRP